MNYEIKPLGGVDLGQLGLQLMQGLAIRDERNRRDALKQGMLEAYRSGDLNQIAEFAIQNPEAAEIFNQVSIFKDKASQDNAVNAAKDILTGGNPVEILTRRADFLEQNQLDSSQTRRLLERAKADPTSVMPYAEMVLAGAEPQAFKAWQSAKGGMGDDTSAIKDFEYYQNLKKDDPEAATLFAKGKNYIPRDKNLSSAAEKALMNSQEKAFQLGSQSREYELLANDFERFASTTAAGTRATFNEFIKSVAGSQDEETELRRRFAKVRLSEALKFLPPGPATDRDVQEAFKGVPKENASPEQVQMFLRGSAKLAAIDADFQRFKANWLSEKNNTKGMLKAWEKSMADGEVESVNALQEYRDDTPDRLQELREKYLDG